MFLCEMFKLSLDIIIMRLLHKVYRILIGYSFILEDVSQSECEFLN